MVTRNVFKMLTQRINIEGLYNNMRRLKLCNIKHLAYTLPKLSTLTFLIVYAHLHESFHFEGVLVNTTFLLYVCVIMLCMLNHAL